MWVPVTMANALIFTVIKITAEKLETPARKEISVAMVHAYRRQIILTIPIIAEVAVSFVRKLNLAATVLAVAALAAMAPLVQILKAILITVALVATHA